MFLRELWPDDRIAELKQLFQLGLSAAQIAGRMSTPDRPLTRNAIIGKQHRLGLSRPKQVKPDPTIAELAAQERKRQTRAARKVRHRVPVKPYIVPPKEKPMPRPSLELTIDQLKMRDGKPIECRWITNDDMANATYCGHEVDGGSWCSFHRMVVRQERVAAPPRLVVAA